MIRRACPTDAAGITVARGAARAARSALWHLATGAALAAIAIGALVGPVPAAAAAAGGGRSPRPVLVPSPRAAYPGETIVLEAHDVPPDIIVFVQVCGDGGLASSAACDQSGSATISTTQSGSFRSFFRIGDPPVACPCVIQVVSLQLSTIVTIPFHVLGVPDAPLRRVATPDPFAALSIKRVVVQGSGPWTSWFGGTPERSMRVTVENAGSIPLRLPPLIIHAGVKGTTTLAVGTSSLGVLPGHTTRSFSVPLAFGYFSAGTFIVSGFFAGLTTRQTRFAIATSMFPWGAVVVAILLALIVAGGIGYAVMRRRRRAAEVAGVVTESLVTPLDSPHSPDRETVLVAATAGTDAVATTRAAGFAETADSGPAGFAETAAATAVAASTHVPATAPEPPAVAIAPPIVGSLPGDAAADSAGEEPVVAAGADRRHHRRAAISGQVQIGNGPDAISAQLIDLSEGGLRCSVSWAQAESFIADQGRVEGPFVFEDDSSKATVRLAATGVIARVGLAEPDTDLGIAFSGLDEAGVELVRRFMKAAAAARQRRPPVSD